MPDQARHDGDGAFYEAVKFGCVAILSIILEPCLPLPKFLRPKLAFYEAVKFRWENDNINKAVNSSRCPCLTSAVG